MDSTPNSGGAQYPKPPAPAAPNMLQAALWYVKPTANKPPVYIFPVHEPLFDAQGNCIGCTCEPYRRSDKCKQEHPDRWLAPGKGCENPGKCPRVKWREKSTIDPAQIREWWSRWPTANIGIDCGKTDWLVLDADEYKKVFGGLSDFLSVDDQQTPDSRTGGGGRHLIYAARGKPYGNSTKGLPPGIDIRGVGGYVVAAPSLHKTGNRYRYADGYHLSDTPLLPIPEALDAVLRGNTPKPRGESYPVGESSQEAVNSSVEFVENIFETAGLSTFGRADYQGGRRWILKQCPYNPPDNPHAEDAAAFVLVMPDGRIAAGCQHSRCRHIIEESGGTGWDLLRKLTGTERKPTDPHPGIDVHATLAALRIWNRTTRFEPFVPSDKLVKITDRETGDLTFQYRTDSTDTRVFAGLISLWAKAGRLSASTSDSQLAMASGCGRETIPRTLARLCNLVTVTPGPQGSHYYTVSALIDAPEAPENVVLCTCASLVLQPMLVTRGQSTACASTQFDNLKDEYTPGITDDPFMTGTSRPVKKRMLDIRQETNQATLLERSERTGQKWYKCKVSIPGLTYKEVLEANTVKAFGEPGLRMIDALGRGGDMTAKELATETGKKIASIQAACRHLEAHNLIASARQGSRGPKTYSLTPDWKQKLAEIAPDLKTFNMSAAREDARLVASLQWNERQLAIAQPDERQKLTMRATVLSHKRVKPLTQLYPGLTPAEIREFSLESSAPRGPHPGTVDKVSRLHAESRLNLTESRRAPEWAAAKATAAKDNTKRVVAMRREELEIAGFAPRDAQRAAVRLCR